MSLNTSKCNHLTPLHFKGLRVTLSEGDDKDKKKDEDNDGDIYNDDVDNGNIMS